MTTRQHRIVLACYHTRGLWRHDRPGRPYHYRAQHVRAGRGVVTAYGADARDEDRVKLVRSRWNAQSGQFAEHVRMALLHGPGPFWEWSERHD